MSRCALNALLLSLLLFTPLLSWADDAHWIDVRTAQEYAAGHVRQAVNIPYEEIAGRVAEVTTDKNELIYVYCRSGRRSGIAKETLDKAGYTHVVNVGGLEAALKKAAEAPAAQ